MFLLDHIVNSIFLSITYILHEEDSKDCWLVDCGDVENIIDDGWNIRGVLLTHAHADHIYGLNKLIESFPKAKIYTNEHGLLSLQNPKLNFSRYHDDFEDFIISKTSNVVIVKEGTTIQIGNNTIAEVMETPGHSPSCLSFKIGNAIFTGDAYIPGIKTVTTFPHSNKEEAAASLQRLQQLSRKFIIYPGHKI